MLVNMKILPSHSVYEVSVYFCYLGAYTRVRKNTATSYAQKICMRLVP